MLYRSFELSYCTNVHPGEGLGALQRILTDDVRAVQRRTPGAADGPFGVGLRLGHEAVVALADEAALAGLVRTLQSANQYVATVNGFPYGDFAAPGLKAAVYTPDWTDPARLEYTLRLGEVLAALPGPTRRTISTVAGGYRRGAHDEATHRRMAAQLLSAAEGLDAIAQRTGVGVRLCLEPEPETTIETTDEAVAFFCERLWPGGDAARAHLGLCYDCCHQAVLFEDPNEALDRLTAAGVPIGKVQISSALSLNAPRDDVGRAALLAFAEPTYLHQVAARCGDEVLRALDLPELERPPAEWLRAEAWRCHFHVPIWWRGEGALGTTREAWVAVVRAAATGALDVDGQPPHLEVETYTWQVVPAARRAALGGLHGGIAKELAAVQAVLDAAVDAP